MQNVRSNFTTSKTVGPVRIFVLIKKQIVRLRQTIENFNINNNYLQERISMICENSLRVPFPFLNYHLSHNLLLSKILDTTQFSNQSYPTYNRNDCGTLLNAYFKWMRV